MNKVTVIITRDSLSEEHDLQINVLNGQISNIYHGDTLKENTELRKRIDELEAQLAAIHSAWVTIR